MDIKIEALAITRNVARQIRSKWSLSEIEFNMVKFVGWINRDAIERGSPMSALCKIGSAYYWMSINALPKETWESMVRCLPQIFIK